jgi:hypothetical protein
MSFPGRLHPLRCGVTKLPLAQEERFDWQLTANLAEREQSATRSHWTNARARPFIGGQGTRIADAIACLATTSHIYDAVTVLVDGGGVTR